LKSCYQLILDVEPLHILDCATAYSAT
jgi:hypothetical protein